MKQAARGFKGSGPLVTNGCESQFVSAEITEELKKYLLPHFIAFVPDFRLDTNGAEFASLVEFTV